MKEYDHSTRNQKPGALESTDYYNLGMTVMWNWLKEIVMDDIFHLIVE